MKRTCHNCNAEHQDGHYCSLCGEPLTEAAEKARNPLVTLGSDGSLVKLPLEGWQPIETAPRTGDWIILTNCNETGPGRWDDFLNRWAVFPGITEYEYSVHKPTHWTPLPAPPTSPAT